jgi:hypothetical protein
MNVHIIDSNSENDEEMSNTTAKVMNKCLIGHRTSQMIIAKSRYKINTGQVFNENTKPTFHV